VEFVRRLKDALEVKEGSRVELAIELSRSDSSNYVVWQKDGRVPGERASVLSDGTKHVLVIEAATVHDEGEYIVSVGEQECSCEVTIVGESSPLLLVPYYVEESSYFFTLLSEQISDSFSMQSCRPSSCGVWRPPASLSATAPPSKLS
jgi:hypothetical protein